jgi:hypothetical protein
MLTSKRPRTSSGGTLSGSVNTNGITNTGNITTDTLTVNSTDTDSGTLTVSGVLTLNNPITMNSFVTPVAGQIGYVATAFGPTTPAAYGANGPMFNVCSLTLGVGVWSMIGSMYITATNSTVAYVSYIAVCVSTTSGNDDNTNTVKFYNGGGQVGQGGGFNVIVPRIVTNTASTTYYLNAGASYSTNPLYYDNHCFLKAVRIA